MLTIEHPAVNGRPDPHPAADDGWRWVRTARLDRLTKHIDRQARRAAKLGVPGPALELGEQVAVADRRRDAYGEESITYRDWQAARVTGPAPRLNGWRLVARVEHVTAGDTVANLFHCVPGEDAPARYRTAGRVCEHCNRSRMRRDTFIVTHDDGTYKQVGRQCIADFLGHTDPNALLAQADWATGSSTALLDDDEPAEAWGMRDYARWPLESVVRYAWQTIQNDGWVSGSAAYNSFTTSTKSRVLDLIDPPRFTASEVSARRAFEQWVAEVKAQPCDPAFVESAIAWAAALPAESTEYLGNLRALALTRMVSAQALGLAVSLVTAYQKAHERDVKRAEQARLFPKPWAESSHVGVVGERSDYRVQCVRITYHEGHFGTTALHTLRTEHGDILKWWCSNADNRLPTDEWLLIKATVKAHGEYRGTQETTVNRVKNLTPKPETTNA